MKTTAIPEVFEIPDGILSQHSAVIGRTGSGKTFAAKGLCERILRMNRRVCIIDPTGAWWGLRSSSDGKSPGFPVVVFGGDHADVPITEHSGSALGELLGTQNIPAILDLSTMGVNERHRFMTQFAEAIFRVNKNPLHLIIDEADEFAPQSGQPGTERMLGAIDRIVRRGRIKGFRVMMITQRPAVINKNVFTQASTLIAMRLPAPQDRKAVEDWIKGQADVEQGREVLASLAKLDRGEGWIWAAEAGILQRTKFPAITTFDSGRTPEDGQEIQLPKRLAEIDLTGLTAALEIATADAKGKDPVELKKRIKELEEQLAKQGPDAHLVATLNERYQEALKEAEHANARAGAYTADFDRLRGSVQQELAGMRNTIQALTHRLDLAWNAVSDPWDKTIDGSKFVSDVDTPLGSGAASSSREVMPGAASAGRKTAPSGSDANPIDARPAPDARAPHVRSEPPEQSGSGGGLTAPQRKVLWALAWWATLGTHGPTRAQLAAVAGYSPTSGGFGNLLSQLNSAGLIQYPSQGAVSLTLNGRATAGTVKPPTSLQELFSFVRGVLDNPQAKVLDALLEGRGAEMTREAIAKRTHYSPTSGGFGNILSRLSSMGLITRPRAGSVKPAEWLFPKGLQR